MEYFFLLFFIIAFLSSIQTQTFTS